MKPTTKAFMLMLLSVLFMIPLAMLYFILDSRESDKQTAVRNIERGFGSAQAIVFPMIEHSYSYYDKERKHKQYLWNETFPNKTDAKANLKVETRQYSIYETQVYSSEIIIKGTMPNYNPPRTIEHNGMTFNYNNSFLKLIMTDSRGIKALPELKINGKEQKAQLVNNSGGGWAISLFLGQEPQGFEFEYKLALNGTGTIAFVPLGTESSIALAANWRHPSFKHILPDNRNFTADGFTANWTTIDLAQDITSHYKSSEYGERNAYYSTDIGYYDDTVNAITIKFINDTDIYSMVDRSIKYGFLFPSLTFLIIFTIEALIRRQIHPIQYGFTGFALVVFFLLLLSMSEHMGFGISYLAAAAACLSLISFYTHFAFKSFKITAIFTGFLAFLYMLIYLLLNLNEYALLIGSLAVFAILAAAMISTSRHNWYESATQ